MILGDRLFEERMLPRIFNLFYLCILIFDNTGEFMKTFLLVVCCLIFSLGVNAQQCPLMLYGDTSRVGVPYSKDPHVVNFKGRYLMYHSIRQSWQNFRLRKFCHDCLAHTGTIHRMDHPHMGHHADRTDFCFYFINI